MTWLALAVVIALLCGAISRYAVRKFQRQGRILLALMPVGFLMTLWPVAFAAGQIGATCDQSDCGPLMFVALAIFATIISAAGSVGSLAGALFGLRGRN
jgi:hypothetical protein